MFAPRPERRPPSAPPQARLPWADMQDSIQDSSQEPCDSLPAALLEPSQLYGCTPDSFEDSQAHLGLRLAQTVSLVPPAEEVAETQDTQLDEEEEEEDRPPAEAVEKDAAEEQDAAAEATVNSGCGAAAEPSIVAPPTPDSFEDSQPNAVAPRAGGPHWQPAPPALDLGALLFAGQPARFINHCGTCLQEFQGPDPHGGLCLRCQTQVRPGPIPATIEAATVLEASENIHPLQEMHMRAQAGRTQQAKPATPPRVRRPATSSEGWNVHNLMTPAQACAANTPSRRQTKHVRGGTQQASTTPGRKRRRPGAAGPPSEPTAAPEPFEDDWPRRVAKRMEGVAAIKRTPEYTQARAQGLRDASNVDFPLTPDPTDVTMSKRTWESKVQSWRQDLRGCAAAGND